MENRVSVDITEGVAHVRLTRADKMNALDDAMFHALRETGNELSRTTGVRSVVLSGEGRAFCAGLDMGSFAKMANADSSVEVAGAGSLAERTHGIANGAQAAAWVWREMPVPVVAAVHGVAFGGGFQVCLGADIRYAAPDTRFSVMEIKWGLVPDVAGTRLMKDLARDDVIRELTYTGRIFSAEEALAYGFVTRVVDDPVTHALEIAAQIAARNPQAQRANKRLLNTAHQLTDAEGLLMESEEQDAILGTPNQVEAVMAELEKRAPNFRD